MQNKTNIVEIKAGQTGTGLLIESDGYIAFNKDLNKTLYETVLNERENGNDFFVPDPFRLYGLFQKSNTKNANGRIYPDNILRREIEKFQHKIKERASYLELNHPAESTVDLGRICALITELYWEKNTVLGALTLETTPAFRKMGIISCLGDLVAHHILSEYKIGVSSRALGSVIQKYGDMVVGDDLELITWDIVSEPSTPGSWIAKNPQDLAMYVENTTPINNNTLFEKLEKFTNIL